ncbi:3-phosphoshikimate 1-carboxyvinyltransferase [Stieleria bergensis]|uniref:3-phosphoshikimate 1-carboxyvinyltransferase n=1 Tax=Stieleria bergensis TaxID=2528025 RepID=A0A517SY17_9BACT|nr:3-phosphoshikimate 1-carboxyvinyltransferase [Planctomycetes bacterium SV_7m_r]
MDTDVTAPADQSAAKTASKVSVQPGGPVRGTIRPPGSKSITNRALICAGMTPGQSHVTGALRSEDTAVMIDSLQRCGVQISVEAAGTQLNVNGDCWANRASSTVTERDCQELFIANSGTTVRFLTAALSAAGGHYQLQGVPRMHQRPIGDLIDALQPVQQGNLTALSADGCPPVLIQSQGWNGKTIQVGGSISSQYLSGLMMACPIAAGQLQAATGKPQSITVEVIGELVSKPYVDMTANVMRSFGAEVQLTYDDNATAEGVSATVTIDGNYQASQYAIEPDASAASYFWAAAAITGGEVTVEGLTPDAMQGDVGFCEVLAKMGCKLAVGSDSMTISGRASQGIDIDMNAISDTVQTLAVVALFADGPTRVRGVAHNRYKETDRIGDLATELRKLGARVDEHEDGLTITPPPQSASGSSLSPAVLETYHDHRMAMSLSLAGLRQPGVQILDPACTGKTYPQFFADLEALIGRPHRWSME